MEVLTESHSSILNFLETGEGCMQSPPSLAKTQYYCQAILACTMRAVHTDEITKCIHPVNNLEW